MWFEAKQRKGADIHGDLSKDHVERDQNILPIEIPENPALEINKKCDHIKNLKSQLRKALPEEHQIFKNVEMPDEWTNACTVVKTRDSWEVFIKAFRDLFVEDMRSRLDSWDDRKIYPDLNKELHSIRKRRNYVEHPNSVDGREEEEKCCLEYLGKRVPIKPDDWLGLQLKALDRVIEVLEKTIDQISRE